MTRWLALLTAIAACSQVTSTDRAKTADIALDALAAICPSYVAGNSGIPKTPELDRVCEALQPDPVLAVPIVESRDGGT